MEMKQGSSKLQRDMQYGQLLMLTTSPDQDMKEDKDYVLGALGIAFRRRRCRADRYGELSIRAARATGAKTEMAKILDGDCHAQLFIFEFLDCFIVCPLADIRQVLTQRIGYEKVNNDGVTSAWYFPIKAVKHIRLEKESGPAR